MSAALGDLEEGRALLEESAAAYLDSGKLPQATEVEVKLAALDLQTGTPEVARDRLAQALDRVDPSAPGEVVSRGQYLLGVCHALLGNDGPAVAALEAASRQEPSTALQGEAMASALIAQGAVHLSRGEVDAARGCWRKAKGLLGSPAGDELGEILAALPN